MRGIFITFEGGEGAGKTSLLEAVYDKIEKKGLPVIKTREPGGTEIGQEIRNLVLHQKGQLDPLAELCLFLASRAQHVSNVILPALKAGKIVLCDRFNDSTAAYQGYARGLSMVLVGRFCKFITQDLTPDLTICLDLDPEIGFQRVQKERKKIYDRIEEENIHFHQKVRKAFHMIAEEEPERFRMIDGALPQKEVLSLAMSLIDELICVLKK